MRLYDKQATLTVIGGILLAVFGLIGYTGGAMFALLMALVFLPMVYSFVLYLKKK